MICEDNRSTFEDIEAALRISPSAVFIILRSYLCVKILLRWEPHNLTKTQKRIPVEWCKEILDKLEDRNSWRAYEIVTRGETWMYSFEPETKRQSTVYVFAYAYLPSLPNCPETFRILVTFSDCMDATLGLPQNGPSIIWQHFFLKVRHAQCSRIAIPSMRASAYAKVTQVTACSATIIHPFNNVTRYQSSISTRSI